MRMDEREFFTRHLDGDPDRPKSSLLTTKLGEDVAVREIEKTLMRDLERHLAGAG